MNTITDIRSMTPIMAQKMAFIFNALENGWIVKKSGNTYVFKQKHHGRKQVYEETYLEEFIKTNLAL